VPEQTVPAGGTIQLTAPDDVTVRTDTDIECFDVLNKRDDCTVEL
jgi:hypothetical protein